MIFAPKKVFLTPIITYSVFNLAPKKHDPFLQKNTEETYEYSIVYSNTLKRLNNKIILPEVNAFTMGQLMMFFMLQTAYTGALLNIDTFNQPGVEEGKNATYALLGREGYEEKAKELNSKKQKTENYIRLQKITL